MSARSSASSDRWRYAAPVIVAFAMLALWQALTVAYEVPAYLVPSPLVVAQTMVADRGLLIASLGVTVSIALYALAIAVALGVAIALVFVQSRWIETAFTPYVVLLQVTPIVAIAPLNIGILNVKNFNQWSFTPTWHGENIMLVNYRTTPAGWSPDLK